MRVIVAVSLAVLLSGCSSGLNRPIKEVTAKVGEDNVQHVRVTAHSFWFDPNRVVVKAGTPVELTVKNGAFLVPHDFTCMAPDAGIQIDAGLGMLHGKKTLRFTPTKAGEYTFFCDVDGHANKGMKGTLVVVAP